MQSLTTFGLFLLISCLLSGCSSKREIPSPEYGELPNWYTKPPANDEQWLTGVGSGQSIQAATQEALNDMLAKLSVQIASSFTSEMQLNRSGFQEIAVSHIQSEVKKIRISNYETVATRQTGYDQFVVLVRSDRNAFVRGLRDDLNNTFSDIEHQITEAQKDHALKRYRTIQKAAETAKKLIPTLLVSASVDSNFNAKEYRDKISRLFTLSEMYRRNLVFEIQSSSENLSLIAELRKAITQAGFALTDTSKANNPVANSQQAPQIIVKLNSTTDYVQAEGIKIAQMRIYIDCTDQNKKTLGVNRFTLKGFSVSNYDAAKHNAANKLAAFVQAHGIEKTLGLH